MEWHVLLSPIGFGLKLLDTYPMTPAPYCWGLWFRAATVHHSTCMDNVCFPSSVRVLNSYVHSTTKLSLCLFNFISHHSSHTHYSSNHLQWTLTGRRPCRPKYHSRQRPWLFPFVNDSPPLPVLRDPCVNGIIDGIYPQQIQYEQRHPPQFYSNATTPHIVTQPDLKDSKAAALLTMLQATAHTQPPSSPLLHWPSGNELSTLPSHPLDVSDDLWDLF